MRVSFEEPTPNAIYSFLEAQNRFYDANKAYTDYALSEVERLSEEEETCQLERIKTLERSRKTEHAAYNFFENCSSFFFSAQAVTDGALKMFSSGGSVPTAILGGVQATTGALSFTVRSLLRSDAFGALKESLQTTFPDLLGRAEESTLSQDRKTSSLALRILPTIFTGVTVGTTLLCSIFDGTQTLDEKKFIKVFEAIAFLSASDSAIGKFSSRSKAATFRQRIEALDAKIDQFSRNSLSLMHRTERNQDMQKRSFSILESMIQNQTI